MKRFMVFIYVFVLCGQSYSQVNENLIKVLGYSEVKIDANDFLVEFTLTEQLRNEYQKTQEKLLPEIKEELLIALKGLDLNEDDLELIYPPKARYAKQRQEAYRVVVDSKEKAQAIFSIDIAGFQGAQGKYAFDQDQNIDEEKLISDAIKNAREKAMSIAEKAGKKIGTIVGIEDHHYSDHTIPKTSSVPTHIIRCRILIYFEMIEA